MPATYACRWLCAAVLAALGACSSDDRVDLLLDLRTDFQPGLEFSEVRTELFTRIPASSDSASNDRIRVRAVEPSGAFVRGERIAAFSSLRPGTHVVRVRLVDGQGVAFLQRIVLLTVRKTSVFTVVMTRDCRGVECPGLDDDPSAIACLGGWCVDPGCTPETPEFCPTGVCEVAVSCVAAASCAQAQCTDEGTCLRVGNNDACTAGQWCNPDVGCVPLPGAPLDAGLDGGDGGRVADATGDAALGIRASVQQTILTDVTGVAREPRVAWTGSEFGVAFQANRGGQDRVYFTRRDASGALVGSEVTISGAGGAQPDVTWNPDGREFAFTWLGSIPGPTTVWFSRYASSGTQIGTDTLLSSTGVGARRFVRWNGTLYGVTYLDAPSGPPWGYYAAVDATGAKVGTEVRVTNVGLDCPCRVVPAWNGAEWGITWDNDAPHRNGAAGGAEIYFRRFDESGSPVAPLQFATGAPSTGRAYQAHTVWTGDRFGVAWLDDRSGTREIYFATLDATGAPISGDIAVSVTTATSRYPTPWLLWDGSRFVVAYKDGTTPSQVVYAQWVTVDGSPIGEPLAISDPAAGVSDPAMAWTGREYAVVWDRDPGVLMFALVTPE